MRIDNVNENDDDDGNDDDVDGDGDDDDNDNDDDRLSEFCGSECNSLVREIGFCTLFYSPIYVMKKNSPSHSYQFLHVSRRIDAQRPFGTACTLMCA